MVREITLVETKVCKKCGEDKPLIEFSFKRPKNRKPGLQPRCKICSKQDTQEWREKQHPDRLRDLYYKRTYGLTLEEFNSRLSKQKGKCVLCSCELVIRYNEPPRADTAVVDHCHKTGVVRGILCNECNRGLGYFHDNKETLMNAVKYLSGEDLTPKGGQ